MKKLFLISALVIFMLISSLSVCAMTKEQQSFFWKYTEAVSSGDNKAIFTAADNFVKKMGEPEVYDDYNTLLWPVYYAATTSLASEDFDNALVYYRKFVEIAEYLSANGKEDLEENIKLFKSVINHLDFEPTLYADSTDIKKIKNYHAKNEPDYGSFVGKCGDMYHAELQNAFLLYVRFFEENIYSFYYRIPEECTYLEIAWNLPEETKEELDYIASGKADEYIVENVKKLAELDKNVFLRFGAEVNCWDIPADETLKQDYIDLYKKAFIKISETVKKYAPKVAMVYSPNAVSNWYVSHEDFYPGDEYVDWVGASLYSNLSANTNNKITSGVDSYYFLGFYDNTIAKIKPIVESFSDKKPIMICECGFAYSGDTVQTEKHAEEKLNEFYTYANMVYPQIKGFMFFDTDMEKDYSLHNNKDMFEVYSKAIENNVSMQASLHNNVATYTKFSEFDEKTEILKLHTFAYFPNGKPVNVYYYLDGENIPIVEEIPYNVEIDITKLEKTEHTLVSVIESGTVREEYIYKFEVGDNNHVQFISKSDSNTPKMEIGDVVNKVLSTDIVAYIDGVPIKSYNIDGNTAIVAEDLSNYGFDVRWNGKDRSLKIYDAKKPIVAHYTPEKSTKPAGTPVLDVLYTDIRTYVNGRRVRGNNANGCTIIYIDELSAFGTVSWDGKERAIKFVRNK